MRDVTDNPGELAVGEVKRGRGRPRKPNAMTNAERQAAFRARHRQSVTVTKNAPAPPLIVEQVDAYDECRLEVDALRAELAEAHKTIDDLSDAMRGLRSERDALWRGVEEAQAAHGRADVARAKLERDYKQLEAAAMKAAPKPVTGNGNQKALELAFQLLQIACKRKTYQGRRLLYTSSAWKGVHGLNLEGDLYSRFADLVFGPDLDKTVTRKAVTKKGA
ncbi:hypothetical protein AEMCBJ_14550 [Cupriavidus necator]|uniref:hypothetical protein n=1 Tax=Cupriavidus necator TaxID=106590 RepID=UPI003F733437